MPHLRPQASPFRGFIPYGVFDCIQCILKHCLQLFPFKKFRHPSLAGQAAVAHIQRLHVQILAQLKIFMEAQPIIAAVMPHQLMSGPFPDRPHYIFKLHGCFRGKTFHNASAGKTEETGLQISQLFHQIPAQSMPHVGILRHQGTEAEIYFSAFRAADYQSRIPAVTIRCKAAVIPHIAVTLQKEMQLSEFMCIFLHRNTYFNRGFCPCKHIKMIPRPLFRGNSAKARIIQLTALFKSNGEGYLSVDIQRIVSVQAHLCVICVPGRNRSIRSTVFPDPSRKSLPMIKFISPACPADECIAILLRMAVLRLNGILKAPVPEKFRI